jgi:transposase
MTVLFDIDVTKEGFDRAAIVCNHERPIRQKSFLNTQGGVERAIACVPKIAKAELSEVHAALEAAGAYYALAARPLATKGMTVFLVNRVQIRSFGRGMVVLGKTARIDAMLLAQYGYLVRPKAWSQTVAEVCSRTSTAP